MRRFMWTDHPTISLNVSSGTATQTEAMEDCGYMVIRFHHQDDWPAIFARYPHIFGRQP